VVFKEALPEEMATVLTALALQQELVEVLAVDFFQMTVLDA
jgi:hypothetical protein